MHEPPTLDQIRAALTARRPRRAPFQGGPQRASVALVLAGRPAGLRLAMIRRAERADDPWSGHMALPGGRADESDPGPEAVAERETREEVGIGLTREHLLATLDELPVIRAGVDTGIVLSPVVYYLGEWEPPFRLNGEVADAFWVPLEHLLDPAQATGLVLQRGGQRLEYPGIEFQGDIIWGLTYRVLGAFFELLGRSLPGSP